ncbi:MAG: small acid-soluble spore protein Tlp [Bacillota bacterium]|nr:small acid-soluble spore protein Tlp [Bacillota bacterium]
MPKPDDRSDNVARLQEQIENTFENLREAQERLRADSRDLPEEQEDAIRRKNQRRREAIEGFREEIRDEVDDRREAGAAYPRREE